MAALNRPSNATYTIHESVTVDTTGEFFFVMDMFCPDDRTRESTIVGLPRILIT